MKLLKVPFKIVRFSTYKKTRKNTLLRSKTIRKLQVKYMKGVKKRDRKNHETYFEV